MATNRISKVEVEISANNDKFRKGFEDSQARMRQFNRLANTTQGSTRGLSDSFRTASQNIAAFQGPLGPISGRLSSMSSLFRTLNPLVVGAGLAFTGFSAMALASIRELDEYELRLAKTEAIIRATGGTAGLTADQIAQLADDVAENTLASVNGVLDASNALLTFKSIQGDVFGNAIELSQDLSAVMGTDIKSSALQLGKALEDPLTGLTALRRAGVSFSTSQKDMIREMVETGRLADAQKYILAELATQIGGAGEAESRDSVAGAADLASQRWGELKRSFNEVFGLKEAAKSFWETLANGMQSVSEFLDGDKEPTSLEEAMKRLEIAKDKQIRQDKLLIEKGVQVGPVKRKIIQDEIDKYQQLVDKIKEKEKVVQDAAKAAADQRQIENQAEQDAKAQKELEAAQNANAKILSSLDSRLQDEQSRINLAWDEREKQISDMVLSENEIRARGFEDIDQLKDHYRQLNDEKLNAEFENIEAKEQAKRDKELADLQAQEDKKRAIKQQVADQILQMEQNLTNNLIRLAFKAADGNNKAQAAIIAVETGIQAARAFNAANLAANLVMANRAILGPEAASAAAFKIKAIGYANAAAIGLTGAIDAVQTYRGDSGSSINDGATNPVQSDYPALTATDSASRQEVVIQQSIEIKALDGASVQELVNNNREIFVQPVLDHVEETGSL